MTPEEGSFTGAGGLRISTRTWVPGRPPAAAVVLVHGMAEHAGRHAELAEALAGAGHLILAPDLAGHGLSGGRRVDGAGLEDHVADAMTAAARARELAPGVPLFLFGHSMGGLIALLAAVRHQEGLDGLITSGAVAAVPARISALTVMAGRALSRLAPHQGVTSVDLTDISSDAEVVAAYKADPLVTPVHRISARLGMQMYDGIREVRAGAPSLRLPLLVMHGTADSISDPAGSRYVHDQAGSDDRTLHLYEGLRHEIFHEPQRGRVTADLLAWLEAHLARRGQAPGGQN